MGQPSTLNRYIITATSCLTWCLYAVQSRVIELTAPGNKPVVYTVRLVGHADFSLEVNTLRVEPGTPATLPLSYTASTTNAQVRFYAPYAHLSCKWVTLASSSFDL